MSVRVVRPQRQRTETGVPEFLGCRGVDLALPRGTSVQLERPQDCLSLFRHLGRYGAKTGCQDGQLYRSEDRLSCAPGLRSTARRCRMELCATAHHPTAGKNLSLRVPSREASIGSSTRRHLFPCAYLYVYRVRSLPRTRRRQWVVCCRPRRDLSRHLSASCLAHISASFTGISQVRLRHRVVRAPSAGACNQSRKRRSVPPLIISSYHHRIPGRLAASLHSGDRVQYR